MRSVLVVAVHMSRAFFMASPALWPTSSPFALRILTTSEPMLSFWSTTTSASLPAFASKASTLACLSSNLLPRTSFPSASTA